MNAHTRAVARLRGSALGRSALAVVLAAAVIPARAYPQGRQRPPQRTMDPNSAAAGLTRGRYAPLPIRDTTAGERAALAAAVYRDTLDRAIERALTTPRPAGRPPLAAAVYDPEVAERLGRWSARWQAADDNAAKSLAARYAILADHLGRMSALEDGRSIRQALERMAPPAGRSFDSAPPRPFADIARFFRPVDAMGADQVIPQLVEVERPLNPRGIDVTPEERVAIAERVYRTTLEDAIARSGAARPGGQPDRDGARILDAVLAERLGSWSELWAQAQDAAAVDPSARAAAARNRSARPAWAGARLAGPDASPAAIRAHLDRMRSLEEGQFLRDLPGRGHGPADPRGDSAPSREFVEVARFFRIEARRRLPEASRSDDPDLATPGRIAAVGRIYRAIWDDAARRHREKPRAPGATADPPSILDSGLAERLASWSIRWGRVQLGAGPDAGARFAAVRAHLDRMAAMEDGRALRDALARVGGGRADADAPPVPREFAEVARFFRLTAVWEWQRIRAR